MIPFYINWNTYTTWLSTYASLQLTDDAKFIGFVLCNIAWLIMIFFIIKIFKFFLLLIKNMIF